MTSTEPWDDMRGRLEAANLVPAANISWPNEPFEPPSPPAIWLAVESTGDVLAPIEIGSNGAWQEEGRLYVLVQTPAGSGSADARVLAKQIANTFRGLPPANVKYLNASLGAGQDNDPQGQWWTFTVTVDWRFQDIVTSQ